MKVTEAMIGAARQVVNNFYRRRSMFSSGPFGPMPDTVIRAMLEAAVGFPLELNSNRGADDVKGERREWPPAKT